MRIFLIVLAYVGLVFVMLGTAGIISFVNTDPCIGSLRTDDLFALNYESPFRVGLAVYYSMPSPASDPIWSGVAGLGKLFGARAFREITSCENERIKGIIQEFVACNQKGAVIAFQKDAYLGVRDDKSQERAIAAEGKWNLLETRCASSHARLFRMPPTRYMNAQWYTGFLMGLKQRLSKLPE